MKNKKKIRIENIKDCLLLKYPLLVERKKIIPIKTEINATSVNPGIVEPPNITVDVIAIKDAHNDDKILLIFSLKILYKK